MRRLVTAIINGTNDPDTLNGTDEPDEIHGGGGDDTINGNGGGPSALSDNGQFDRGTAEHDGDDRIIYDSANGHIYYDADGMGPEPRVLFAIVGAGTALTNADFFIVA